MITIGITGHRELLNSRQVINDISICLDYYKELDENLLALTSLSKGTDTLFAEAAISKNIPIKILIPFDLNLYKTNFIYEDLTKFENLIENRSYEVISKITSQNQNEIEKAYLVAGKLIVDKSDILLAVWDGNEAKGIGGTGDVVKYAQELKKQVHIIKVNRNKFDIPIEDIKANELFDKLDSEANYLKNYKFEASWIAGIITGLLAALCFACVLSFPALSKFHFFLSLGEAVLLLISITSIEVFAKKWKKQFLETRRSAEYLRILIGFKDLGIPILPFKNINYNLSEEIKGIENVFSNSLKTFENISNVKRAIWCLAEEQIKYHKLKRIKKFTNKNHYVGKFLNLLLYLFISVIFFTLILEGCEYFEYHFSFKISSILNSLKFLWIILPLIYASIEGVKYFSEWKQNIEISHNTISQLERIKYDVHKVNTEIEIINLSTELRRILEIENSNWAIRYSAKTLEIKP